ncbi:hypothetical protein [Bacillus thuringiensis]|uniref:hypothetical protein n=1 Tax=Bacillus thuringiensis TaxID=1428 RepID=UPI0037D14827
MARLDLTGKKFNLLEGIEVVGKSNRGAMLWKFKCDCGNEVVLEGRKVKGGETKSCGCLVKEHTKNLNYTHGFGNTRLHKCYSSMISRCYHEKDKSYKDYGGRGIGVCDEWRESFLNFREWALKSGYSDSLTIDRIDVNKWYAPENCKWSTKLEQANNKRSSINVTYKNETKTLKQWCKELNLNYSTIYTRIFTGNYDVVTAFEKPIRKMRENNEKSNNIHKK